MGAGLRVGGTRLEAISSDNKTSFTGINKIKFGESEWSTNKLLIVTIQSFVHTNLTRVLLKFNKYNFINARLWLWPSISEPNVYIT